MRILFFLLCCFFSLHANEIEEEGAQSYEPELHITNHEIQLLSGPLSYTAITGFCPILADEEASPLAELFFIAYLKEQAENRPITFIFPGGPGGAGTLEAILSFGPRRLLTAAEGRTILPPYEIIDNPETLLEYTDLVFVDPVDCGFSRSYEEANLPYIYSVEGDIQILGQFIHSYIDFNERWNSPIYLAGGSYGSLRCCGLASNLFRYGLPVHGLILDGCALEGSTHFSQRDKALPDCLLIPTFAATAWYHGRLWPNKSLEEVVDYARRFAFEEYAPFMLQPSSLSPVEKDFFYSKLAFLIGLSPEIIKRYNGRINETIYTAEFFGSERKVLGGLDTRYSGDISTIDPDHAHDPSYLDSIGYAPAFKAYLQKELDTRYPLRPYIAFAPMIRSWNFNTYDSLGEPNFLQRLRRVLVINPLLKIFIGAGYYDCRTPFAATEYCFDHLDLPPSYQDNFQFEYYQAGHGILFDHSSLKKWKEDLTKFYGY